MDYPFRQVEMPSDKAIRRLLTDLKSAIETNKPVHKMFLALMVWTWGHLVKGKIPTGLTDPSEMYSTRLHPVANELLPFMLEATQITAKLYNQDELKQLLSIIHDEAASAFLIFKSLSFSDDLNWFIPSEDLVYSILATDLKGLGPSDVFLPLPVIFIELPPRLFWMRSDRGIHEVRAIGVTECISDFNAAEIGFRDIIGLDYEVKSEITTLMSGRRLFLNVVKSSIPGDTGIDDVSTSCFSLPLNDPDVCLTDLLDREEAAYLDYRKNHKIEDFTPISSWGRIGEVECNRFQFRKALLSFVLGILMYMTTTTATRKPRVVGSKTRKKRRGGSSKSAIRTKEWLIGSEIKLSAEVRESINRGTRSSHVVKTVVRGYFRRQHHGPKNSLIKIIQIQPTVRNYGLPGSIQGHTYRDDSQQRRRT